MREPNKDKDINNVTQTFRFDTIKVKSLSYNALIKLTHFLGLFFWGKQIESNKRYEQGLRIN